MPFTKSQQGQYRALEKAAWQVHCRRRGLDSSDTAAYVAWYRAELKQATGRATTRDCDGGRHWEAACAHFEALGDLGIAYQLKLIQGDLRRIRHAAAQIAPEWLRQFATDADLERYVRGIVRQAFGRDIDLHRLDDAQIRVVTQAVRVAAARSRRP